MRRNSKGQYAKSLSRFVPIYLLTFTVAIGLPGYYKDSALVQRFIASSVVEAQDHQAGQPAVPSEIVSSSPAPSDDAKPLGESTDTTAVQAITPSSHDALIEQIFGDKADEAKLIMKCESGGNANNVGDTHLFVTRSNGDRVGDSIGLFQIRTGGKEFNRARANGMTPDEFRAEMKNPEKNIRYAKSMYDNQGWNPWFNCMKKLGL